MPKNRLKGGLNCVTNALAGGKRQLRRPACFGDNVDRVMAKYLTD